MNKKLAVAALLIIIVVALSIGLTQAATLSNAQPADKVVASASVIDRITYEPIPDPLPDDYVPEGALCVLSGTFKSSSPTDLLIQVTMETALYTKIKGGGNMPDYAEAAAKVVVWVEIDGDVVPVTSDSDGDGVFDDPDDGVVVFNYRAFGIKTINLDETQFIELFIRTRSANGFNWIALNVGSGQHTFEVWVELTVDVDADCAAEAGVGKRTAVIEPCKMANNAVV